MSTNIKVVLLALTVALLCAGIFYFFYYDTPAYSLYKEALSAYEKGDLDLAYNKVEESLKIDNKNKNANKLRSDIFFLRQSAINLANAQNDFDMGEIAFKMGNYPKAASHFNNSLSYLDNITKKAPQFQQAEELRETIRVKGNTIALKLSSQSYDAALKQYKAGELYKAFNSLTSAPVETPEIVSLKSDIAFNLGLARYNEIQKQPNSPITFYNDAIYWLKLVSPSSAHYKDSMLMVQNLQNVLNNR